MKLIAWMSQEIFKILNQYAVEIPTLPVDQCLSHLIQFQKDCWGLPSYRRVAKKGRQAFGTRMVSRETFLQIQLRPLQHIILRNWIHGVQEEKNRLSHPHWKRVRDKHKIKIRDVSLDRQFFRYAVPQRRAAKHLGHGKSGNVFANPDASSSAPYPQDLHQWNSSLEEPLHSFVHSGEKWKTRTKSRSEMPVWTVSQRFSHLQWRRLFK